MSKIILASAVLVLANAAVLLPLEGCTTHRSGEPEETPVSETSSLIAGDGGTPVRGNLVISQVYAGGGSTGATFDTPFVELLNKTASPLSLNGLSIQYSGNNDPLGSGDAAGAIVPLSGTVAPGEYVLIGLAPGAAGDGAPLPTTPDITGTIAMDPVNGKVALATSTAPLACGGLGSHCPPNKVHDLVGYGQVNEFEGAQATAQLDGTKAALRKGKGCTDANENGADFDIGAPAPRNGTSPKGDCAPPPPPPKEAGVTPPVKDPPLGEEVIDNDAGRNRDAGGRQGGGASEDCSVGNVGLPQHGGPALAMLLAIGAVFASRRRRR